MIKCNYRGISCARRINLAGIMSLGRWIKQLHIQMMIGIVSGVLIGHFWPSLGKELAPLGVGFVKLLRMMVPPILLCTIVEGVVAHGGARETGSIVLRSFVVFFGVTIVALLTGLVFALWLRPGDGLLVAAAAIDPTLLKPLDTHASEGGQEFFLRLIPDTFFSAFTAGDVLPVLFIAGLIGFGLLKIGKDGEPIIRAVRALTKLQFAIFGFLLRAAPIGACGSIAYTVGAYGIGFLGSLSQLFLTLAVACASLVMFLLASVRLLAGYSAAELLFHFKEEFLIILGTSSSEVVLPRLIAKLEKLGAPSSVAGLTIPAGYSLNLAATAVYLIVATMFLSEATQIRLSPERVALFMLLMLITSKTAAGVSGSGFSALLLTLSVLPDIPVGAATILVAADRFLSPLRAVTSCMANITASLLVAKWTDIVGQED